MTKIKKFFKDHWIDVLVVIAIVALLALLCASIAVRFKFDKKFDIFYRNFIVNEGYTEVLKGLGNTAIIAILGLIIGIVIGTLIAVVKVIPSYSRIVRYLQKFVGVYVAFFRGTPIVVQLLVGYYILFPLLGMKIAPVDACIWIFGLNSGAYISEIMRGGINSVDKGQLEAARAVGLPFSTSMIKIVVPQAVKNILPTLGNEFIALIKETAVVGYVGAVDITVAFQYLGSNSYEYMIPYLVMALIYIVLVAGISMLVKLMERKFAKSERRD
ncbi:MAG: amino acid ABC transporter permease [Clostridia bacterium]|nr:amino acid ABC transporter permease [Clostridia bacterium]